MIAMVSALFVLMVFILALKIWEIEQEVKTIKRYLLKRGKV